MIILNNFKEEYRLEKPIRAIAVGSGIGIYIPRAIVNNFFPKEKYFFPLAVLNLEKVKIGLFFKKPNDYGGRIYTIYRLERKEGKLKDRKEYVTYLPIPRTLYQYLKSCSSKKEYVSVSIGYAGNSKLILLEDYTG
jgi:hypothetical protein